MNLLVIDPGQAAGWAFFVDDVYIESGVCVGNPQDVEALQYMCQIVGHTNPDMLVVETQFGMPGRGTKNLVPLLERRFVWETLCRLRSSQIRHVVPAVWQRYFDLLIPKPKYQNISAKEKSKREAERSKKVKQKIVQLAQKKAKKKTIVENEADAVLMGFYALELLAVGKLNVKVPRKKKRRKKKTNGRKTKRAC